MGVAHTIIRKSRLKMKRIVIMVLCVAVAVAFASCKKGETTDVTTTKAAERQPF